jgi:Arc-like DNA binding dprotein
MAKKPSNMMQVHVRMPKDLHRGLLRDAERRGQTLNAEILRRIYSSYRQRGDEGVKTYTQILEKFFRDFERKYQIERRTTDSPVLPPKE